MEFAKHIANFVRRYVLGVPAEGVAEAIDEVDSAFFVLPHHVAGAEPPEDAMLAKVFTVRL